MWKIILLTIFCFCNTFCYAEFTKEFVLAHDGWEDTIPVGGPTPSDAAGIMMTTAVILAADMFNNRTCENFPEVLLDTKLTLYTKIDHFTPAIGIANTVDFFDKGHSLAIGYPISDVSIQSAVAATVYDIAILASVSTASRLADEKSFPYFTRIGADAAEQTVAVKDAILYYNSINGGGWTNVGIISTINEITTDFAEIFSAVAGPEIDVVTYQQFLFGTEDLSVELNELKNSGARVFLGMIFGEWERFAALANEFGLMGEGYVWFVPPQTVGVPFSAPSEVSRGILGVNDFFPKTSPFTECFTKAWGSADPTKYTLAGNGGIPPPTLTYRAFDTVMIAAIAIDKVDKMGLLESGERVPAQTWNDVMRNMTNRVSSVCTMYIICSSWKWSATSYHYLV